MVQGLGVLRYCACNAQQACLRGINEVVMQTVERNQVETWFNQVLEPQRFKDYGPNGLQVEGGMAISHVVSGVTASLALIEAAVAVHADAIVVHHGLFWRGQSGCVTGWMKQRLQTLLKHDINLFAYHLPLDAHPQWGNNAQLAQRLGWQPDGQYFGDQSLGWTGLVPPQPLGDLVQSVAKVLERAPVVVGNLERSVRRVGWCSGGAQGYFEAAIEAGVDVFLTGEISEPQAHVARETGVAFMACGHHATERYGAPALAQAAADALGLRHTWIEVDNPA
jgi:dinuclear metal center YbgI/SA1388 family protein